MSKRKAFYNNLREQARKIVSKYTIPEFYVDFQQVNEQSKDIFETDQTIEQLKQFVCDHIENNCGHGMLHVSKVALDAGALMIIEGKRAGYSSQKLMRQIVLAQCAGLFHDIKRKHQNHAELGAIYAKEALRQFSFESPEIDNICIAIRNHEAFKDSMPPLSFEGALVADCLYDGDKFRWGPDNFTDTVWDMVIFHGTPISKFLEYYPKGMEGIAKIQYTFRTVTGKKYGPQFIEIGLAIGVEIYDMIKSEFGSEFKSISRRK